jgi:FkbM family methyltransferase
MTATLRVTSVVKTRLRKVLHRIGYDVVRLSTSFSSVQSSLLDKCDLLVDVGANCGQYAQRVRVLGYGGPIISFEPQADAFAILDRTAARDDNWEARRLALGADNGVAFLRVSANSVSSSLLNIRDEHVSAAPASRAVRDEKVTVSTLDQEIARMPGKALWLKMDVQGTEMDVIRGGAATLDRVHVVQSELSLSPLYDGQTDYIEICGHLQDRGFRICHILPGFQDLKSGTLLQMDALFVRSDDRTGV